MSDERERPVLREEMELAGGINWADGKLEIVLTG